MPGVDTGGVHALDCGARIRDRLANLSGVLGAQSMPTGEAAAEK